MSAPVHIDNKEFNNTINAWREWEWNGPEPMNKRLMRFYSIMLMNKWNNFTFAG